MIVFFFQVFFSSGNVVVKSSRGTYTDVSLSISANILFDKNQNQERVIIQVNVKIPSEDLNCGEK